MKLSSITLFSILIAGSGCDIFSAGSYPFAERYSYRIGEDSLIHIILSLKDKYPYLAPPQELRLVDGRTDSTDYWYHVYFYNRKTQELVHTWVRAQNKSVTDFAFIGVNEGLRLSNWKEINHDYKSGDNAYKKKEFKELILDKIAVKPVN